MIRKPYARSFPKLRNYTQCALFPSNLRRQARKIPPTQIMPKICLNFFFFYSSEK